LTNSVAPSSVSTKSKSAGLGVITAKMSADIRAGKIDIIVVYKVDRLTRSLADFAKLVKLFDAQAVSFVSVTQQFNTTSSMGRLTPNVLLSFAQFEREVTGERIRDKIAASGL
jgi:site-specific DNA recombinase